jgi:hypothetical protein
MSLQHTQRHHPASTAAAAAAATAAATAATAAATDAVSQHQPTRINHTLTGTILLLLLLLLLLLMNPDLRKTNTHTHTHTHRHHPAAGWVCCDESLDVCGCAVDDAQPLLQRLLKVHGAIHGLGCVLAH